MPDDLDNAYAMLDQMAQEAHQPQPLPAPPPKPKVAAAPGTPPKKEGLLDAAKRIVTSGDTYKALPAAVLRAPGQMAGGSLDLLADAGKFIDKNIDPQFLRTGVNVPIGLAVDAATGLRNAVQPQRNLGDLVAGRAAKGASLADVMSFRKTLGQYGDPQVNQFVTEGLAAIAPVAGGKANLAVRMGKAAVGSAIGFNADNLEGRALNAAIGGLTEFGVEAAVVAGKYGFQQFAARKLYGKVIKEATSKAAAQDALDRSFAGKRTEEARAASQEALLKGEPVEAAKQEQVPPGRKQDAAQGDSLVDDANHALKEAGVAHTVEPGSVGSDGRIQVPPAAKAALDDAGLGRAFADDTGVPKDTAIFAEHAADGSSRVVGTMDRADLQGLTDAVAHYRANPGDISLTSDSPHGQWSMAHLGTEEDTPALLRGIVDSIPGKSEGQSTQALMQAAREAADHFGGSVEDALAFGYSVASDHADVPVALKTMQTIWSRMGSQLADLTGDVDWLSAGDDLVDAARQQIHDISLFSGAFQDAKATAGKGLQVLGLPDADAYLAAAKKLDKAPANLVPAVNPLPLPRTRGELKQWVELWNALDPDKRLDFLKDLRVYPSGWQHLRASFPNFFTAALVSAPKTILLNIVSPAFVGGLRTLERTSGAIAASINPMLSAEARAEARTVAAQAPVAYLQSIGDVGQAFKFAAHSFEDSKGVLAGDHPLDLQNLLHVPQPIIDAAVRDGNTSIPYHLGNLINWFPEVVHRLHGTTNELALHQAYFGEVRAKAMLEASQGKLDTQQTKALVQQRLGEAADNASGKALDADALDSSQRTTFVRSPDPEFAPGQASVINTLNYWRKNVPELRYVLPILQVPANALGETIRRIPGVGFLLKETQTELSGQLGPMRQAEAYGRMMLGAGWLTAGSMMARQGMLTGAGPQDPHDRGIWLATHQAYSLRIGNQWVSYDKMDPVGPLLAIAAGHFDTSVYRDTDRNTTLAAVGALAEYLKDKAALTGLSNLLNIGGDPQDANGLNALAGNVASGFVPKFLQGARIAADDLVRVRRNPWDYIKDALPGASLSLDPQRNLLGEPVHKPNDTLVENMLPVTMSKVSTYADDPILDELDRLYERTGYTPGVLSPAAGPQAHFDYRDVKLEDGKSLYNGLMRQRTLSTIGDITLRQTLWELINSEEYNSAVDGTGKVGDDTTGAQELTRGGMVQRVFSDFTKATKQDVASYSPTARRWMAVAEIKADANDQLRGVSAKEIAGDPNRFLNALGINVEDYEQRLTEGAR